MCSKHDTDKKTVYVYNNTPFYYGFMQINCVLFGLDKAHIRFQPDLCHFEQANQNLRGVATTLDQHSFDNDIIALLK